VTIAGTHNNATTTSSSQVGPTVKEGGKEYRVLIANMGSINPGVKLVGNTRYPGIAEDYARTFERQKALACDIRPGRRPRGPALLDLVRRYQERAGITSETGTEV